MTGHFFVTAQPRGARSNSPGVDSSQPGVEPARASCILLRARAYRCIICLTCSSSSRCRMRRKFFSSGMEKACHCEGRTAISNHSLIEKNRKNNLMSHSHGAYIDLSCFILLQNQTEDLLIWPGIQTQTEGTLFVRQLANIN